VVAVEAVPATDQPENPTIIILEQTVLYTAVQVNPRGVMVEAVVEVVLDKMAVQAVVQPVATAAAILAKMVIIWYPTVALHLLDQMVAQVVINPEPAAI
jgi:hypothetical protein